MHKVSFYHVLKMGLGIMLKAMPKLSVVRQLNSVLHALALGGSALFMQRFLDSIPLAIENQRVATALVPLVLLSIVFIAREIMNGLDNFFISISLDKGELEGNRQVNAKIARIDPVEFENTAFHDMLAKTGRGLESVTEMVVVGGGIFTFYLPYLLFMFWFLQSASPWLLLAMVFVFLPTLIGQMLKANIAEKFEDASAPIRRKCDMYDGLITQKEFFKETRLLGFYTTAIKRFVENAKALAGAEWNYAKKQNVIELSIALLTAAGWGGVLALLAVTFARGSITVGTFAAVFASVSLMFKLMGETFGVFGRVAQKYGAGRSFVRFMRLPEVVEETRGGGLQEIVFDNVGFTYPNAPKASLQNVSIAIQPGETIAIVGENGAGKSTLVRLMLGMYKPTTGQVSGLARDASGVFQKYQRYQMTLGENVAISDMNTSKVREALAKSGIDVSDKATFPQGVDTMLSREFDGVELSGGQWQRIAIARGLHRPHDFIVLDEPTAAIDPIEESNVFKAFAAMAKGKTTVLVTHRLGITALADRVLVLKAGEVVGFAPHAQLMGENEYYRDMYNAQAMWYR